MDRNLDYTLLYRVAKAYFQEPRTQQEIADVENFVHSCGFYRQKAKDIVQACQMLIDEYGGKVPDSMIVSLAKESDIVVLTTAERMFPACGKLYENGLGGTKTLN